MKHDGTSVQNELFWRGISSYEPQSIKLWSHLAVRASIIVDAGAHNGLFSLVAGAINPSATIVAFEPEPGTFDKLAGNCALNSFPIKAERLALSDTTGMATFFVPEQSVGASLDGYFSNTEKTSRLTLRTSRLDDYLKAAGLPGVDLIKIDVERYEAAVIRGLGDVLSRSHPIIVAEILTDQVGRDVLAAVNSHNYRLFLLDDDTGLLPVSNLSPPAGKVGQNFLLCPENKVSILT
jgi:FkbM family methyltransferase